MSFDNGPKIITDGLVLSLDAADINSYPGSGTSWFDMSGNGNNVSLTGTTFSSINGGILTFNGSSDYGSITTMTNLNNQFSSNEAWVKYANPLSSANEHIIGRGNTSAGTFNILKSSSNLFSADIRNSTNVQTTITGTTIPSTNWVQITSTYNGTTFAIYINGVLENSTSLSSTINTGGTLSINIGRNTNAAGYLNGSIAVARIYNRGLTATEVFQNYNAQKTRFGL